MPIENCERLSKMLSRLFKIQKEGLAGCLMMKKQLLKESYNLQGGISLMPLEVQKRRSTPSTRKLETMRMLLGMSSGKKPHSLDSILPTELLRES